MSNKTVERPQKVSKNAAATAFKEPAMQFLRSDLRYIFTNRKVQKMYLPVLGEQAMTTMVGIIATIMVGHAGSVAISAVGVVSSMNMVILNTIISLCSGAAAVTAQFLGADQRRRAEETVGQFLSAMTIMSAAICLFLLLFARQIISFLFGAAEQAVLDGARIYLYASAISLPFNCFYAVMSAVLRGCGNNRTPMMIALLVNVINTGICAVTIYFLQLGVVGAAIGLVVAKVVGAVVMFILMRGHSFSLKVRRFFPISLRDLKPILTIGLPMGFDTLLFNGGKLLVQVFMAGMGTHVIAANSVAFNLIAFVEIPGNAMTLLTVTLTGFSVGAKDFEQARADVRRTSIACALIQTAACIPMYIFMPQIAGLFSDELPVLELAIRVSREFMIITPFGWAVAFNIPAGLRAAGDVRYTVSCSLIIMWVCRVLFSWILGVLLHMGLPGIWYAMYMDWVARTVCFVTRFCSNRWENRGVT